MNADGYVTIGTKLDTKDLEKGIRQAETELRKYDNEAKRLTEQKMTLEADNSELQQTIDKYDDLFNKARQYEAQLKEMEASGQLWSSSYDTTQRKLESINTQIASQEKGMLKAGEQIDKNNQKLETINKKLKDNASNQEVVNTKVKQMNTELTKSQGIGALKSSIDSISGKMSGIVHTAIRWGLAIFGVRSAYMGIRSAISTLSQYDKQLATDVEYIRWALAMTLKPVIEFIVKLAYQLLGIIRKIILFLFNYDIFAKSGAEAFKKAKQSTSGIDNNLGKSVKKAKELNKQLASFDEMNILGDNTKQAGDTGTSGGVSGSDIPMPSYDLSDIIKDNIDWSKIIEKIKTGLGNIGSAIKNKWDEIKENLEKSKNPLAKPIAKWMEETEKNVGDWLGGLGKVWGGITDIIEEIFGDDDIDWDKVGKALKKIGKGIGEMIWAGVQEYFATQSLFVNLGVAIGQSLGDWIRQKVIEKIQKLPSEIASKIAGTKVNLSWSDLINGAKTALELVRLRFLDLKTKVTTIFKNIGTSVGNAFKSAFKIIFNKLVSSIESRLNTPIKAINSMIGVINKLLPKKQRLGKLKTIKLPRLAKGGIVNMPSTGVPVGTAIAGERGAEGVIPLTDSQQMALLGEAIGKYITINANITNSMNGRVISRELQKIQNDNNFAYNR